MVEWSQTKNRGGCGQTRSCPTLGPCSSICLKGGKITRQGRSANVEFPDQGSTSYIPKTFISAIKEASQFDIIGSQWNAADIFRTHSWGINFNVILPFFEWPFSSRLIDALIFVMFKYILVQKPKLSQHSRIIELSGIWYVEWSTVTGVTEKSLLHPQDLSSQIWLDYLNGDKAPPKRWWIFANRHGFISLLTPMFIKSHSTRLLSKRKLQSCMKCAVS